MPNGSCLESHIASKKEILEMLQLAAGRMFDLGSTKFCR